MRAAAVSRSAFRCEGLRGHSSPPFLSLLLLPLPSLPLPSPPLLPARGIASIPGFHQPGRAQRPPRGFAVQRSASATPGGRRPRSRRDAEECIRCRGTKNDDRAMGGSALQVSNEMRGRCQKTHIAAQNAERNWRGEWQPYAGANATRFRLLASTLGHSTEEGLDPIDRTPRSHGAEPRRSTIVCWRKCDAIKGLRLQVSNEMLTHAMSSTHIA